MSLDTLRLALSIAEGPSLEVGGSLLTGAGARPFKRLVEVDALVKNGRADSVLCQECERGHVASVTFDPKCQISTYFCPEAGRVTVDPIALDVYELRLDWLLDWLAVALRIPGRQRPISLIKGRLWELGQANVHHQQLRVMFARRISSPALLGQIETAAERRAGKTGVIMTGSSGFSEPHRLPSGFSIVDLENVLDMGNSAVTVDLDRLLIIAEPEAMVDPYRSGTQKRRTGAQFAKAEHERRVREGKASKEIGEEARYLERWYAENHPDGPSLSAGTIENVIREDHNRYRTALSSTT